MTKVKICGVNSEAAFDAVVEAGADYLGFVFFQRSPRFVTPSQAAALTMRQSGGPLRVGLFVDPGFADIAAILDRVKLDILQVYADAATCRRIRTEFGVKTWRAIGVAAAGDLPQDSEALDGFHIEAKPPKDATRPGGNAVILDWQLLAGWRAPAPWLLGGGLNPANVAQAIAATNAPGVDVSSGVESAPGVKSPEFIHEFVARVRQEADRVRA